MKPEEKMIYEEYHGKPYALLLAVVLGIGLMAVAWVCLVCWVVNLIFG